LGGDPGAFLALGLTGIEHDELTADDDLGDVSIAIPRHLLLLHRGGSFERTMPLLTGESGEYAVTVRVHVNA
jgi:hypothetical protein